MAYIYESQIGGLLNFTIPDENKTVKLFRGDTVTVQKKLTGAYLRALKLVGETEPEEVKKPAPKTPAKKATTRQKAKVADKITAVVETEEITKKEEIEVKVEDTITEVIETPAETETPAPKRRGRKKKTS